MTNCEHLIENALYAQKRALNAGIADFKKAKNEFMHNDFNIAMAEYENIPLSKIWEIAMYVTYDWCEKKDI